MVPWLEMPMAPLEDVISRLEGMQHRRVIKTHLALDGVPYFPEARYIVVGRDGRDVAMSLWAFYNNFSDSMYQKMNNLPRCPDSFEQFWSAWIARGWFDWEREGYPFWSPLHFAQTWWDFRYLPNILFMHFNDMLKDLEGAVRRVADYLSIDLSPARARQVTESSTFDYMKRNVEQFHPLPDSTMLKDGPARFFYKGTNGRWKDVLTKDDLELYQQAVARALTPDCARWLENGGEVI